MSIDVCPVNHLPPVGSDRPSLRVIVKGWWGNQLFVITRIGCDPPQRELPIRKQALYEQSSTIRLPVRTDRALIIAVKLQGFHALAINVEHPDLVVPQPITGIRDPTAIGRDAGLTVEHIPCAQH